MMTLIDVLSEAWWELKRARLRTYLALLGIVIGAIGLTILICTLHLENALRGEQDITTIEIRMPTLEDLNRTAFRRAIRLKRYRLTPEDGEAVRDECPHVGDVFIIGIAWGVDLRGKNWRRGALMSTNITRLDRFHRALRFSEQRCELAWGRLFTPAETASGARVVVIDQNQAVELWPKSMRTLGNGWLGSRYLHINGHRFEVIGVLRTLRGGSGRAFVPYTCMRKLFWNATWVLEAAPRRGARRAAAKEIDDLLLRRIGDPGSSYVALPGVSYEELRVYLFFGVVGVLVLFSAGAAVSNKAYIDSLERLQQFAVRRALGATRRRVCSTMMVENAIISGFGGLYGGIIGWMVFASFSAPRWLAADIVTPGVWAAYTIPVLPLAAMLVFFVSLGLLGSLQGAAVAASVDPAEALAGKEVV